MKKSLCATALISVLSISSVSAAEWTSGWAMGTTEYTINDGNQNELLISCSDDDSKYVQAYATINGQVYSSENDPGFNVILDGTEYTNPFDTYCNVCGQLFPSFWEHLRTAKTLQISQRGQTVSLPTTGIDVIKPLDHPENTCRASW